MASVVVVYRGPKDVTGVNYGSDLYIFEKDRHQEVPEGLSQALLSNNPELWQMEQCPWCNVFEVVKPTGGGG